MVIWIGQIACHSAIQQPGCSMRTANRWGVFISFLTMPWEKKNQTYFKCSDGYLNIFSINSKGSSSNPVVGYHQDESKSGSRAGGAKGSLRGSQHHGKHRRAAALHGTNACCQCIIPCLGICTIGHCSASCRSFPAPRPPHAAAHGKDPSGGWLGFNVPKSSQSLPPYCLPHWHFFFKYMFGKQLKTVISSTPSRTI